jgi:hypothetical protein
MLSQEGANTNFLVFGLTRMGIEPMIYCTSGGHANHYTTDAFFLRTAGTDILNIICLFFHM